jgi:hypothetical protein
MELIACRHRGKMGMEIARTARRIMEGLIIGMFAGGTAEGSFLRSDRVKKNG